ncbi:MAG: YfiR family protein [Bacteroidia bacterium]|nr:YfiR family protein [Bacteroidia bacterium]
MLIKVIVLFLFLQLGNGYDRPQVVDEYDLKAAYLYNFTNYITWNDMDTSKKFIIGVIGDSPIIEPLLDIVNERSYYNKEIVIKKYNKYNEIGYCHILFIPESEKEKQEYILQGIQNKNMLTIAETRGAATNGVCINFFLKDNKLRFEINLEAVYKSKLKISSQLLKLGVLVDNSY